MAETINKTERKLKRIGVMSAGITLGALYAILGVIYAIIYIGIIVVFGALLGLSGSDGLAAMGIMGIGMVMMVVGMPIIFAIMGFIAGALMALVYNFVAKYTGGIAFEVSG